MSGALDSRPQAWEDHDTLRGQSAGDETRYTILLRGQVDDRWADAFRATQAESPAFQRFRFDPSERSISFSCRTVDGPILVFDVLERLEALLKLVNQRVVTWYSAGDLRSTATPPRFA